MSDPVVLEFFIPDSPVTLYPVAGIEAQMDAIVYVESVVINEIVEAEVIDLYYEADVVSAS